MAVGGAGRGEDDLADPALAQRVEEAQRPRHVVPEVPVRMGHGLADIGVGREVNHGLDLMLAQRRPERRPVAEIGLHERPPAHGPPVSALQGVQRHGEVAGRGQRLRGMAADVSGAAGDENAHGCRGGARDLGRLSLGDEEAVEGQVRKARALEGVDGVLGRADQRLAMQIEGRVEHGADARSGARTRGSRDGTAGWPVSLEDVGARRGIVRMDGRR